MGGWTAVGGTGKFEGAIGSGVYKTVRVGRYAATNADGEDHAARLTPAPISGSGGAGRWAWRLAGTQPSNRRARGPHAFPIFPLQIVTPSPPHDKVQG